MVTLSHPAEDASPQKKFRNPRSGPPVFPPENLPFGICLISAYSGRVMRLSKRAEYALRALTAMARRPVQTVSQIEELSTAEGLPPKVLEQILLSLKKAGLLRSKRGVGGGYQLNRAASALTLGEVLRAVDGPFLPVGEAPSGLSPGLLACFSDLTDLVNQHLDHITLADVLARESGTGSMHFDI